MTESGGVGRVFDALKAAVCPDSDVVFAVAFGSRVTGDPTPGSDLDVAIKFDDALSDRERFERRCRLSGTLQHEDAPFVDCADIETLPIDVAHDAVTGTFVCGDEEAFKRYQTRIKRTFAEQRDTLRRQQRAVIDRIAEDGLRA